MHARVRSRWAVLLGLFTAATLLAGCTSGSAAPDGSTTASSPSASSASSPSESVSPSPTGSPTTTPEPTRTGTAEPTADPTTGPTGSPTHYPDADTLAPPSATTGLRTVTIDRLPKEAVTTLRRIKEGGPFPYPQDGLIFENRERILPKQESGFYHEFTVTTPGSADRGPRRIVTGADGSRFWTTDHYQSFREIIAP